jgi:steroid 5-alpha reductase family enzyme
MRQAAAPMVATRSRAFAIVTVAYLLAIATAAGAVLTVPSAHPLVKMALGAVVATLVVFAFSRAFDNTSVYDPFWSVTPMVAAIYLYAGPGAGNTRSLLLVLLISAWSWRLTLNWARSWRGLEHEDWRYADIRKLTGGAYWWASAFGLHLFPTVIVLLGLLPIHAGFVSERPFGFLDVLATGVTAGAIALETVADEQLKRFCSRPTASVCDVGLWRYSRHPNYLGEIAFWLGLWLFGLAAGAPWWTVLGPVAMLGLFLFASIPLMERHLGQRRAGYAEHRARTSMLLPWPPRS